MTIILFYMRIRAKNSTKKKNITTFAPSNIVKKATQKSLFITNYK